MIWHFCQAADTKKVEKVQERALRIVFGNSVTYGELLKKSSSNSLYIKRLKLILLEIYIILNNSSPLLENMFKSKDIPYLVGNKNLIVTPKYNTVTYGYNSFRYQGAKLWNSLIDDMKSLSTFKDFKCAIIKWSGPRCNYMNCIICKTSM